MEGDNRMLRVVDHPWLSRARLDDAIGPLPRYDPIGHRPFTFLAQKSELVAQAAQAANISHPLLSGFRVTPRFALNPKIYEPTDGETKVESSCRGAATLNDALDIYEGEHAIPLMTIPRSKGLEYHTVIFVGLDDGAWFAFQSQTKEEMCSFFVAFTRAKQRVIFSYCTSRGQRTSIAPLYSLLKTAGVNTVAHCFDLMSERCGDLLHSDSTRRPWTLSR